MKGQSFKSSGLFLLGVNLVYLSSTFVIIYNIFYPYCFLLESKLDYEIKNI